MAYPRPGSTGPDDEMRMTNEAKIVIAGVGWVILIASLSSAPEPTKRPQKAREVTRPQVPEIAKETPRPAKVPVIPPAWSG